MPVQLTVTARRRNCERRVPLVNNGLDGILTASEVSTAAVIYELFSMLFILSDESAAPVIWFCQAAFEVFWSFY